MPKRIIYVHKRAKLSISDTEIDILHQDYKKGSLTRVHVGFFSDSQSFSCSKLSSSLR